MHQEIIYRYKTIYIRIPDLDGDSRLNALVSDYGGHALAVQFPVGWSTGKFQEGL